VLGDILTDARPRVITARIIGDGDPAHGGAPTVALRAHHPDEVAVDADPGVTGHSEEFREHAP